MIIMIAINMNFDKNNNKDYNKNIYSNNCYTCFIQNFIIVIINLTQHFINFIVQLIMILNFNFIYLIIIFIFMTLQIFFLHLLNFSHFINFFNLIINILEASINYMHIKNNINYIKDYNYNSCKYCCSHFITEHFFIVVITLPIFLKFFTHSFKYLNFKMFH